MGMMHSVKLTHGEQRVENNDWLLIDQEPWKPRIKKGGTVADR